MEKQNSLTHAKYTAIISDLHLCEAEPLHPKYPLWKKYKTRQFFFDEQLVSFIDYIQDKSNGETVELILNGDIFDFDSVTTVPDHPTYRVSNVEQLSGMLPQNDKSVFKINRIMDHHADVMVALKNFVLKNNRLIFVIGNHDLELHWPKVQQAILDRLDLPDEYQFAVRFNEWFYISNQDTLVEHGNQYDPYCLAEDPIHPFIKRHNRIEIRIPFGNWATRFMINNMGFFNPHVDSNFIMSAGEYVKFFFKYMLRAQPLLIWTWMWTSTAVLLRSFTDRIRPSFKDPLRIEDKIESVAYKANATPRMVRELRELSVTPANSDPFLMARELWLDRAFLVLLGFYIIFHIFLYINKAFGISMFWAFIPLLMFLPFFVFYSRSVVSDVHEFKEPREKILWISSTITKTHRVIYGHTHEVRHEMIGPVEHLNSGTWSPAFKDVECHIAADLKTFIWICPKEDDPEHREAKVYQFKNGREYEMYPEGRKKKKKEPKSVGPVMPSNQALVKGSKKRTTS